MSGQHVAAFLFFYIVAAGSWTLIATTWADNAAKIRRALTGGDALAAEMGVRRR